MASYFECDNSLCCYQCDGYCHIDEHYEFEGSFCIEDIDDYANYNEDYDYDYEIDLFEEEEI